MPRSSKISSEFPISRAGSRVHLASACSPDQRSHPVPWRAVLRTRRGGQLESGEAARRGPSPGLAAGRGRQRARGGTARGRQLKRGRAGPRARGARGAERCAGGALQCQAQTQRAAAQPRSTSWAPRRTRPPRALIDLSRCFPPQACFAMHPAQRTRADRAHTVQAKRKDQF